MTGILATGMLVADGMLLLLAIRSANETELQYGRRFLFPILTSLRTAAANIRVVVE
jgi:hypothetical protein